MVCLPKVGRRALHEEITKQGLTSEEILSRAEQLAREGGKYINGTKQEDD